MLEDPQNFKGVLFTNEISKKNIVNFINDNAQKKDASI
jgi:hypothetical protein